MNTQNAMFKIIAPQLLVWGSLQIFYHGIRGFSHYNFGIPGPLLSMSNMLSSTILGSTVLKLIVVWITIHRATVKFQSNSYQMAYWFTIVAFIVLVAVTSALSGINPSYYHVTMRVTLVIWVIYLLMCIILLLVYGVKVYRDASRSIDRSNNTYNDNPRSKSMDKFGDKSSDKSRDKSSDKSSDKSNDKSNDKSRDKSMDYPRDKTSNSDPNVKRTLRWIPIMLSLLCGMIFVPTAVGFIFYASALELIERSSFWPLIIWGVFWTGSIVYVNIWSIYFWRTVPQTD